LRQFDEKVVNAEQEPALTFRRLGVTEMLSESGLARTRCAIQNDDAPRDSHAVILAILVWSGKQRS
jgi:hypothetical protein